MGWILYFTMKVLELIVKALKLWWKLICKCFTFIVLAVDELKTLKWEKEEDKPKIIKNSVIITVGVLAIIFLIWLLVSIFNGSLGGAMLGLSLFGFISHAVVILFVFMFSFSMFFKIKLIFMFLFAKYVISFLFFLSEVSCFTLMKLELSSSCVHIKGSTT